MFWLFQKIYFQKYFTSYYYYKINKNLLKNFLSFYESYLYVHAKLEKLLFLL